MKKAIVALLLLLLAPVNAVIIHGNVLDANLQPVEAIAEIEPPRQVAAVQKGESYEFNVAPNSRYTLTAITTGEISYRETVDVEVGEENLRFDVILLTPNGFEEDEDLTETINSLTETDAQVPEAIPLSMVIALMLVIGVLILFAFYTANKKNNQQQKTTEKATKNAENTSEQKPVEKEEKMEMDKFKREIEKIIREKGGAIEQKELRRELPWSEARVSIELSELEKMGAVKKIKKGRANLIKLV